MKDLLSKYSLLAPMDVDKKHIVTAFMKPGKLLRRVTFPYDVEHLLNYFHKHFANEKAIFCYEAGPTGYGLHDELRERGEDCLIAVPSMIPKAPSQRVKTNKVDAYHLGCQMVTPDFKFVEVPEKKYRDLRHLTKLRFSYRKDLVRTKNRIKALYLFEGIVLPEGKWSREMIAEMKKLESRESVEFNLQQRLTDLDYYAKQELKVRAQIRRYCKADPELDRCIQYMRSVSGVGPIVSSYVLASLGGWKQLKSVRKTCGFYGLGPSEDSTGEKVRRGSITASGDPIGRKMIIQASWVAIKKDSELKAVFQQVYAVSDKRFGRQKAIVAVGRKLVCRLHAVLRDQRPYDKNRKTTVTERRFRPGERPDRLQETWTQS